MQNFGTITTIPRGISLPFYRQQCSLWVYQTRDGVDTLLALNVHLLTQHNIWTLYLVYLYTFIFLALIVLFIVELYQRGICLLQCTGLCAIFVVSFNCSRLL